MLHFHINHWRFSRGFAMFFKFYWSSSNWFCRLFSIFDGVLEDNRSVLNVYLFFKVWVMCLKWASPLEYLSIICSSLFINVCLPDRNQHTWENLMVGRCFLRWMACFQVLAGTAPQMKRWDFRRFFQNISSQLRSPKNHAKVTWNHSLSKPSLLMFLFHLSGIWTVESMFLVFFDEVIVSSCVFRWCILPIQYRQGCRFLGNRSWWLVVFFQMNLGTWRLLTHPFFGVKFSWIYMNL